MMAHHFDRIKILFLGEEFSSVDIFTKKHQQASFNISHIDLEDREKDWRILGFEIEKKSLSLDALRFVLKKNLSKNVGALYFQVGEYKDICKIKKIMAEFQLNIVDIYGIDPDSYHSCVVLGRPQSKIIETFVLNLKDPISKKGRLKQFIKKSLIFMNCSHFLYENFIIVAILPPKKT